MHCSEGEVVEALDGIEVGQAVHLGLTLPGVNVMYPIALVPPISRSNITITQAPLSFSFNFEPASLPPQQRDCQCRSSSLTGKHLTGF